MKKIHSVAVALLTLSVAVNVGLGATLYAGALQTGSSWRRAFVPAVASPSDRIQRSLAARFAGDVEAVTSAGAQIQAVDRISDNVYEVSFARDNSTDRLRIYQVFAQPEHCAASEPDFGACTSRVLEGLAKNPTGVKMTVIASSTLP